MSLKAIREFLATTELFGLTLADLLLRAAFLGVVTFVAWSFQRGLVKIARRALKGKVPSASLLLNILRGFIWFMALLMVLEPVFGIKPTAFVAALGVGSLAISLGLQDTVSNVIGGLVLMMNKSLEPGDCIRLGDFTGWVTDVNWRTVCVCDQYGQVDFIPNSVLWKSTFVKISDFVARRVQLQVMALHGSDMEEIRADVRRVATEVLGDWYDPSMGIQLNVLLMDPGGIILQVSVHVMPGVMLDEARARLAGGISGSPWVKKV